MTLKFSYFVLFALLMIYHGVETLDVPKKGPDVIALKYVETLDDNCVGNICTGFQFDDPQEVAFFDLKTKINIMSDSTYDISPPDSDVLIFKNSTFIHFPIHLFYSIALRELDMRNCFVQYLTWENFLTAKKLDILLLSDNQIEEIQEETFFYAPELQFLFLERNRIRSLVNESFKGLKKLTYLSLAGNQLSTLPEEMFNYLPALQEFNVADNLLTTISEDIFSKNPKLMTMVLRNNKLFEINEYAFKNQLNMALFDVSDNGELQTLVMNLNTIYLMASNCSLDRVNIYGSVVTVDLRDNKIMELYFSRPESLESLNLRNNSLVQIVSLTQVKKLRSLTLADNPDLSALPEPWFINALERLDVSNTSLTTFPTLMIEDENNLRFLNISYNKLHEINPENFKYLQNLQELYIQGNEWNCYNLQLLMDLVINLHKIHYSPDAFDPDFPGEYFNDIACMYRIEEQNEEEDNSNELPSDNVQRSSDYVMEKQESKVLVEKLQNELQTIVQFYEQKFDLVFKKIDNLNKRLEAFERLNETMFQHITIST